MKKYIISFFLLISSYTYAIDWVCYGTIQMNSGVVADNPTLNNVGIIGEISSLPYIVPSGYTLNIAFTQIEGPAPSNSNDFSQVGMMLWLGDFPCTNSKCVMSTTTGGGSISHYGMNIKIPEGSKVNLRFMNNTVYAWVNGFYLQGTLDPN